MSTPPPIKPPEQLPSSLKVAENVTEEEYSKSKRQFTILWIGTMAVPLLSTAVLGLLGILFGWVGMGALVGTGVVTYIVLYAIFPEAKKMSTMRLRKYKELKAWRTAKAKFDAEKER